MMNKKNDKHTEAEETIKAIEDAINEINNISEFVDFPKEPFIETASRYLDYLKKHTNA